MEDSVAAMKEELTAMAREMELSIRSLKAAVDESHSLLREIVAGKPHVDGPSQEIRLDKANPILGLEPSTP
jgi:hypothetical protein